MITRIAGVHDAALIAELSRQTFTETFAAHNSKQNMDLFMAGPFSKDRLMQEVGVPGNVFILVQSGDDHLGYVKMSEEKTPAALPGKRSMEIERIYVVKKAIGKGAGKLLMQECIDMAITKGMELLWLGVWEHNHSAIQFYQQWGFEKFDTHIFKLGNDEQTDWLMKKELN